MMIWKKHLCTGQNIIEKKVNLQGILVIIDNEYIGVFCRPVTDVSKMQIKHFFFFKKKQSYMNLSHTEQSEKT